MCLLPRKLRSQGPIEVPERPRVTKLDLIWRALLFTILELGYLALATRCLAKPVPILPGSAPSHNTTAAKAIITAIAVAWHAASLFPVKGIISTVFSAECIAQYRRTGQLQPNITDCVSCITSGLLAQISHFLTLRATSEYRLAFLLALLTAALAPLGPSVVGLSPSWATHHEDLQIANLTMTKGLSSLPQHLCFAKAGEIANMEVVEGITYGYETQTEGLLIPWPGPGLEASQSITKYQSDVVVYNYTCQWPKFTYTEPKVVTLEANNVSWTPWFSPFQMLDSLRLLTAIGALSLSNPQDDPLPSSAFIFSSDLFQGELGTITNATWITVKDTAPSGVGLANVQELAAVLLCEPQYAIHRAEVTLQGGQLNASLLEQPLLGNFPEPAANSLFSQAFLGAFANIDSGMSRVAQLTFILDRGRDHSKNWALRSLPEINQNMNKFVRSAAKAYISGFTGFDDSQLGLFPNYTSFTQIAVVEHQKISLVTSKTFLIVLWGLYATMVSILLLLLCTTNVEEMQPFSLQTMQMIYRALPMASDNLPVVQNRQTASHISKLAFAWRMLAFIIPELGFLAFARYCLTKPIPVYLPPTISAARARSIATAVTVVWHTLAVFPVNDIVGFVFSAECMAQYRRTGRLESSDIDQVSRPTSSMMEQIPHFLTRQSTSEYRLTFLLSLLVLILGPVGPGVVTLTESPMIRPQALRVANMSMTESYASFLQRQISERVRPFVELELLEGRMYGYNIVTEGVLIPWPESGLERSQNVTRYESDVVVYNYSCYWSTPFTVTPSAGGSETIFTIPGMPSNESGWSVWAGGQPLHQEGISPLMRNGDAGLGPNVSVSYSISPLSAVAFSGNSTQLDLRSTGASVQIASSKDLGTEMSLNFLLCDPHFKIRRANITSYNGALDASLIPTLPLIGNFPEFAANAIFSQGLLETLGPTNEDPDRLLGPISMLLFTGSSNGTGPLHPYSLPVINENMNRAIKSAAKAYLSGYNSSVGSRLVSYAQLDRTGSVEYQQNALVTSKPFFIVVLVLVGVTAVILMTLFAVADIGNMQLFNLETLEKVYGGEACTRPGDQ